MSLLRHYASARVEIRDRGPWLRLTSIDSKKPVEITELVFDDEFDTIVDELKKHVELAPVRVF